MANLITITIDPGYLTQQQAIIKGLTMLLDQNFSDLGKPVFEVGDDEIAVILEVEKQ